MIRIVTDTDSNMPQHVVDEYDIALAPIHILFGDEIVREHFEISPAEAYERMAAVEELPKTSQPPIGEFKAIYERLLADDPHTTIISLHISEGVSGTMGSARQAAAMLPEADIRVFDTRTASLGQGLMARQAAELARQGVDAEDIMAQLAQMRDNVQVYFVVKTLDFLAKGGRIGWASHLMGSVLAIKPLLTVTDGVIDAHSRFRTWKQALGGLRDLVLADVPPLSERDPRDSLHLGVVHAVNAEEAQPLLDDLAAAIEPQVTVLGEIGPGLGVHVGPGTIGVCWLRAPA